MKIEVTMSKENIEVSKNLIRGFGEIIDESLDAEKQISNFEENLKPADEKLISKFASKKVEATPNGRKVIIVIDDEFVGDSLKFVLKAMKIFKPAIKLFSGLKDMVKGMMDDLTKESKLFGEKWNHPSTFEVWAYYNYNKSIRGYVIKEINGTTKSVKLRHKMVCGSKTMMAILDDAINGVDDAVVKLDCVKIDELISYEDAKCILRATDKKDFEEVNGIKSSIAVDNE